MDQKQVWIVFRHTGRYDASRSTPIRVYADERAANDFTDGLNLTARGYEETGDYSTTARLNVVDHLKQIGDPLIQDVADDTIQYYVRSAPLF